MIYLFTALYQEARPMIQNWNLKQREGRIPVFQNETITLALTGTGPLSAASVTAAVLSASAVTEEDLLINAGCAAAVSDLPIGSVYLIHKITDLASGHDCYPDPVYSACTNEASLITGSRILSNHEEPGCISRAQLLNKTAVYEADPLLYDMEAAGIFQAGSLFFAPHQMRFLKLVSDAGAPVTKADLASCSERLVSSVEAEIQAFQHLSKPQSIRKPDSGKLAEDLCASLTMKRRLDQILHWCSLSGKDMQEVLAPFYESNALPASSKEEGKRILKEIEHALLS